ncbi:hypothetical protein HMPREF1991_02887 [Hoylesella loescheii DSM 19665 = JCM 12249 = ATCC 15930]|uniref:Uncharacterized protein n=1 Tax=Hoylesella loescheii DSM 19665 = JCM 12249 = ATCC 15930 TaxID=1122985 RepID=A0A069QGA1_HOYLO|nr:hypothetical protein HMPREF1991_02887 [Hoylesella loescheii DSM 19665 = JCM 12249 = ATCC 15930]
MAFRFIFSCIVFDISVVNASLFVVIYVIILSTAFNILWWTIEPK